MPSLWINACMALTLSACFCGLGCWYQVRSASKMRQVVRSDGPQTHHHKQGTPTAGGISMVGGSTLALLLCLPKHLLWMHGFWLVFVGFACVGCLDDWAKIKRASSAGLSGWQKIAGLSLLTGMALGASQSQWLMGHQIMLMAGHVITLSTPLMWVLGYGVMVGSGNAVNLTDGLDGLAGRLMIWVWLSLGLVAWVVSQHAAAPHAEGWVIVCSALLGSCLAFLWYNDHPAQLFMGDTGSLALGGAMGFIAFDMGYAMLLLVVGVVFVIETMSVAIQVISYQTRGQRVFKMAPLHHHFECLGWPETRVVSRFVLVGLWAACLGLYAWLM